MHRKIKTQNLGEPYAEMKVENIFGGHFKTYLKIIKTLQNAL